jgi:hypothetical protein
MYRIDVQGHCHVGVDELDANSAHSITLGLPVIEKMSFVNAGRLAVVGGGRSVIDHLQELREWDGAVWGINGACQWLKTQGIEATLFSVDPDRCLAELSVGCGKAILGSHCHPSVFEALKDAQVTIFHAEHVKGAVTPMIGGSTSATRVPKAALLLGYREIHYFGCESSYEGATHTFKDEADNEKQLIIRAGDKEYRTTLQFMVQAENLAKLVRELPHLFKDRSGGLLSAMIAHPETWEVVALSAALRDIIDPTSTALYKAA